MALAFLVVIAPNLYWLIETGFMPLRYVDARAKIATHWYHVVTFPLQWTASQSSSSLPAIALMALALSGARGAARRRRGPASRAATSPCWRSGRSPSRRWSALVLGRLPVAMWGYPLWSFAPLAALLWFGPVSEPVRLKRFAAGFLVDLRRDAARLCDRRRPRAARARPPQGDAVSRPPARRDGHAALAREIRERRSPYVGGGEFATNNIAVYSPDRPRVIVHADLGISPWIDRDDLRRRGAVLVWEDGQIDAAALAQLRSDYPGLDVQEPIDPAAPDVRGARRRAPGAGAFRHRAAAAVACGDRALFLADRLALDLDLQVRPSEARDHQIGRGRIGVAELARANFARQLQRLGRLVGGEVGDLHQIGALMPSEASTASRLS